MTERSPDTAPNRDLLTARPRLRTIDAVGQSLAIGPIVSVGLGMFLLAGAAGPATPFVILVVGGGSLALGWCVSRYARRYAGAGAVYEYLTLAHGPWIGVTAAGLYFLPSVVANGAALIVSLLWQDFAITHLGFDPGWWSGGLISIAVIAAVVHLGVRLSVRGVLALTAVSAVPFLITAVAVIAQGGAEGHTLTVFGASGVDRADLGRAVLFGILLFIGFEAAACTGEEARLPHRSIPRAILGSVVVALGFYLLMAYAGVIGFGPGEVATAWGENPTAFASLGDQYVGAPISALMSAAILLDAVAVQLAVFNLFSRGFFALARDGLLPSVVARVSAHGTPLGGLVLVAASNLLVLACAAGFRQRFDVFEITATALTLTSLITFLALAVGAVWVVPLRHRWAQAIVSAVAATVPILGVYGTFDPLPTGLRAVGAALAGGMVVGLAAWIAVLAARRPGSLAQAAQHALVAAEPVQ